MDDLSIFAESRSGDFRDMQRADNAYKRWERDIPHIKRAAFGSFAPNFSFGKGEMSINLRHFTGNNEEFCSQIDIILSKRYYQAETRRKYISSLRHFIQWLIIPLNRVTDKCIFAYLCSLSNSNIKPATYSLHFCALRTIFDCFCGLDITKTLDISIGKKILQAKEDKAYIRRVNSDVIQDNRGSIGVNINELNQVFSIRQNVRDTALLWGLILFDVKLNELLGIRRKDILIEKQVVRIWPGAGRAEKEVELPAMLLPIFVRRMNELNDHDYLFSSYRNPCKAMSVQGVNQILKKIFFAVGITRKISSRLLRYSTVLPEEIKTNNDNVKKFFKVSSVHVVGQEIKKSCCIEEKIMDSQVVLIDNAVAEPERSVGVLHIDIGELSRYKRVVSADVQMIIMGLAGRVIKFKGIRVSELGVEGASLLIPDIDKWQEELLWIEREMKERICSHYFKDRIVEVIKVKYFEKKKSCYIRNKRAGKHWRATG